ncbi:DNA alkylation repair protein [Streptomyces sp. NPDC051561]|uniref:DNA alkylation repair protein n=1 Tax=Streptomyces sp. NPDC051561 TaxID=3365658 RepID=UPI0037B9C7F5
MSRSTGSVPDSALADTVLDRLTTVYPKGADPARAAKVRAYMKDISPTVYPKGADPARAAKVRAYMKDISPFLGIPTPERRALSRTVLEGTPRPDERDCTAIALRCWALEEREYRYFAVDYLRRHAKSLSAGFLPVIRTLVVTNSWWDTVDLLAARVVGPLVSADPKLRSVMDRWIEDPDMWVARTALLHQLGHKDTTDTTRLFAYCLRQAGHPDFFVRKAIGWCLREYAKTDPAAVRDFVGQYRDVLSPLSAREALKNL